MNYKEVLKTVASKEQASRIMLTLKELNNYKLNGGVYLNQAEFNQSVLKAFAVHGIDLGSGITGNTLNAVVTRLEKKSNIYL